MRRRHNRKPKCYWCRREMNKPTSPGGLAATKDHVLSKSRGGTLKVDACRACNQLKGDMLPTEWAAFMKANPKWWQLYVWREWQRSPAELRNQVQRATP